LRIRKTSSSCFSGAFRFSRWGVIFIVDRIHGPA
jgi:hypothetical protein